MDIRKITLDSYGMVEVEEYKTGRHIKHEWNGVPKDVMLRIINCKEPCVKDINDWINKAKDARASKIGKDCAVADCSFAWWGDC